jgi:hypothetical protein
MAYTITKTDGTVLTTIVDGTTDTATTSLTLIGKNFPGYGAFLNQNFVKLLEHFSNSTSPDDPVSGQLWWDAPNKLLKVYQGTGWKVISSSMSASSAPANAVVGDLWWDTANSQLKIYSGTSWVTIGPAFTATSGQSGAIADTILATDSSSKVIVKFFVNNELVGILSKEPVFTPQSSSSAPGFTTIKPGFNLSTSISGLKYWGDADNATSLGGVVASQYARLNGTTAFTQPQTIQNNSGLTLGTANDLTLSATTGAVNVISNTSNNNLDFYVKVSGTATKVMSLKSTGSVELVADPTANLGIATKQYVDSQITSVTGGTATSLTEYIKRNGSNTITGNILPGTTNIYSLGSSAAKFANIHATNMVATTFTGTATQALYADLAERFEADAPYQPGTVVELGGVAEITKVGEELSDNVFGVISTNAAYLMNCAAGTNDTHPPIAMSGRVPVNVIGKVKKGDRLVSAGNGFARSATKAEITPWNVIGRALESKATEGQGQVEAIVKLNS